MAMQSLRLSRMLKLRGRADFIAALAQVSSVGLFALALLYTLYFARVLIIPIGLALFISLVLRPIVRALSLVGIPPRLSALGIIIAFIGLLAFAGSILYRPATSWVDRIPEVSTTLERKLWPLKKTIEEAKRASQDLERVAQISKDPTKTLAVAMPRPSLLERALGFTWSTLMQIVITLGLCFFLLAEGAPSFSEYALRNVSPGMARDIRRSVELIEQNIGRYLTILILTNMTVGAIATVALALLGMPNPVLWGAIAALLGLLPYVGPLVTMALLAAISLTNFDTWIAASIPVVAYAAIHYSISELLVPVVVGYALRLSPAAVFVSVLAWGWIWGVAGAFLAVPILVTMSAILQTRWGPPAARAALPPARAPMPAESR